MQIRHHVMQQQRTGAQPSSRRLHLCHGGVLQLFRAPRGRIQPLSQMGQDLQAHDRKWLEGLLHKQGTRSLDPPMRPFLSKLHPPQRQRAKSNPLVPLSRPPMATAFRPPWTCSWHAQRPSNRSTCTPQQAPQRRASTRTPPTFLAHPAPDVSARRTRTCKRVRRALDTAHLRRL